MRYLIKCFTIVFGFGQTVFATESDWQQHQDMLQTRLIAASSELSPTGKYLLAWEAKLAPGWKTYWRSPGEAGLPVRIFKGEVEQIAQYPLPDRFVLFGLETYGYSRHVVLPFELDGNIVSKNQEIDVDFMVCKDICVPFRAQYRIDIPNMGDVSIHDGKFRKWLEKVPTIAGDNKAGLEIKNAKVVGPVGRQKIIVDALARGSLAKADMLAEVTDMFHFGKPDMKLLADGRSARFVLPAMTGKRPEDLRGKKVRLTFTDGRGAAIDRTLTLPVDGVR